MSARRPHGPVNRLPWGLLPQFHHDPLRLLEEVGRRYPSLATLPFGPWTLFLATDDRVVEDVLRPHKDHFRKGPGMEASNPLIGQGLLLSEGELWRDQRRAILPAFSDEQMDAYQNVMTHEVLASTAQWFTDGQIDAAQFGRHLALAVAMSALFGAEPDSEAVACVGEATRNVMAHFHRRARSLFRPPYHWPAPFNRSFHQASAVLGNYMTPLLASPATALTRILACSPLDRQNAEAITFLIAGHETTGNALAWTLRLLAEYPEVADRVSEEAKSQEGQRPSLAYAEAVCLESLRLYPPVWLISRTALTPVEVAGYRLPEGSHFLISPWVTHRIDTYYPEASAFRPERWLNQGKVVRSRADYRFLAFGGGPRRCPGEGFALREMVTAISMICRKWRMHPLGSFPKPEPGMTLAPKGEVVLKLSQR